MSEGRDPDSADEICVVLDTNIWRSSQLLSDPTSAAFLYALERIGGKIGMPQVIEREAFKHGVVMGRDARVQIEKNLRIIRALVGYSSGIDLPTDQDFESAIGGRLNELESLFHRVPFTVEVALRALDRVDLSRPPSHVGQQYKDSAIWEHCLDLASKYDVRLVTADRAFFEQNNYQKGLERRLNAELDELDVSVQIYPTIESLLTNLAEDVASTFDSAAAADAVQFAIADRLRSTVERNGWVLGGRTDAQFEAFVTERTGVLSVNFSLHFDLTSDNAVDSDAHAVVEGQCSYRPTIQEVSEVKLESILLPGLDINERRYILGSASAVLGRLSYVPHEIRAPLPGVNKFRLIELQDTGQGIDDSDLTE